MTPQVLALVHHGDGLVTREELLLTGISPAELQRALRSGELVRVRRGVYTSGVRWAGLDDHVGRPRLRALAASRTMLLPHALSHDSAAHVWGLDFFAPRHAVVHVTRERVLGSRTHYGVKHHAAPYSPEELDHVGTVPLLGIARTAIDLAREHGLWTGTSACDAALRRGVTRSELELAFARMENWPGVRAARQAVVSADAGAENPAETFSRLLVESLGFGAPQTQFPVRLRAGVAWCDLRLHTHLIEFDGALKYRPVREGGIALDPAQVVWDERQREREICDQGLGMSRLVFSDILPQHHARTRARLVKEAEQTFRRFGTTLPADVARFAAEMGPARRRRLSVPA